MIRVYDEAGDVIKLVARGDKYRQFVEPYGLDLVSKDLADNTIDRGGVRLQSKTDHPSVIVDADWWPRFQCFLLGRPVEKRIGVAEAGPGWSLLPIAARLASLSSAWRATAPIALLRYGAGAPE